MLMKAAGQLHAEPRYRANGGEQSDDPGYNDHYDLSALAMNILNAASTGGPGATATFSVRSLQRRKWADEACCHTRVAGCYFIALLS